MHEQRGDTATDDPSRTWFAHGSGTAIVVPYAAALIAGKPADPAVATVSTQLVTGADLAEIMTALAALGFSTLPAFAIAVVDATDSSELHVLHRGPISVRVDNASADAATFRAATIATWREEVVIGARRVEMRLDAAGDVEHWLDAGGVVPAAALVWPVAPPTPAEGSHDDPGDDHATHDGPDVAAPAPGPQARTPVSHLPEEDVPEEDVDGPVAGVASSVTNAVSTFESDDPTRALTTFRQRAPASQPMITDVPIEPEPPVAATAPASDADPDHDHDGHTVARTGARASLLVAAPVRRGASVQVVRCAAGHANPPHAETCRLCALLIVDLVPVLATRPPLGVLRFSNGQTHAIDGPVVIGRNPPHLVLDGEIAASVTIDNAELSRYHLAVHVADWSVAVSDQGSTNGSVVRAPGTPEQHLRPHEKVPIGLDAVVDLGGAITFRLELPPPSRAAEWPADV